MKSRSLLPLAVLFVLGISITGWYQYAATDVVADFAPTHTPEEAAERVALAQEAQHELLLASQLQAVTPADLPAATTVYFPQTGHHLSNRSGFLDFWRANGQVLIFGYPITEELVEDGKVVQYFERARFEYHPELAGTDWAVQLGLVGLDVLGGPVPADVIDMQSPGVRYFPETRHTLRGDFLEYWERRGGVQMFGYPLTEVQYENGRAIQYFERAKFEYYPEDVAQFYRTQEQYNALNINSLYEVTLADMGRRAALVRGVTMQPVPQIPGTPLWSPSLWYRNIDVDLSRQWLTAYEDSLPVYRAPITTGKAGFETPAGTFAIYNKLVTQTMEGTARGETWSVPNVPWVMYVHGGVALHGTYWHNLFGSGARISHGCINLRIEDAQWLYEWADVGTTVRIHY